MEVLDMTMKEVQPTREIVRTASSMDKQAKSIGEFLLNITTQVQQWSMV
jgi:hypothetical protein